MLIAARNAMMAGKRLPYDAEVEYLTCTGSSYYQFDIKDIASGNNKDCEIEWSMKLLKNQAYRTLLTLSPGTTNNAIAINSIDGITSVGGLGGLKYKDYPTTFSLFKISRVSNVVTLTVDGQSVATTSASTGVAAKEINIFCRGDLASYAMGANGYQFGGLRATFAGGSLDIRTVRIGNRGCIYDVVTGIVHESLGATSATPGPDKARGASAANGGGYKLKCPRRSYRRSSRPSARFWQPRLWKEVA